MIQSHATRSDIIRRFADLVLHQRPKVATVAVGPVVWGIRPGHDQRYWYCMVASANRKGRFHLDQLACYDGHETAEELRGDLMMEFVARRPLVIHDFEGERELANFCAATWPCAKTRSIAQNYSPIDA